MAVYKDNATGTWRVIYRFTNWKGERKQTQKRGFATKREAQAWEHEAMLKQGAKLDMTFGSFFEVYEADKKQRVKESTWESKSHVIRTKILPYFENRKIAEIEAKDVIAWQNELMAYRDEKGKPYSADYLRTIHAQLTAIFNHAVNFYNLPYNPARRAGTIGSEAVKEMDFWTKEEYLKFSEAMMDKPRSYYAFEMLYWCGMRSGELLALTPADIDFEKQTVTISKTFHRSKGRDIITSPKTKKSNRTIKMPPFLCEEMQEYIKMLYDIKPDERLFTVTKSYLNHEMERGAKQVGVKKIRVHDIRHTSTTTKLLMSGGDYNSVMQAGGWSNLEMLTRRYGKHSFASEREKLAGKMDDFLDGKGICDSQKNDKDEAGSAEQVLQQLMKSNPELLIEFARSIQNANKQ